MKKFNYKLLSETVRNEKDYLLEILSDPEDEMNKNVLSKEIDDLEYFENFCEEKIKENNLIYFELWDDIILYETIWRIKIEEEWAWLVTTFYDKSWKEIWDLYEELWIDWIEWSLWHSIKTKFINFLKK